MEGMNNAYASDFGMIDFMDEANLDQFIDLIRGENAVNFTPHQGYHNFDDQLHYNNINIMDNIGGDCLVDDHVQVQLFSPPPQAVDLFSFNIATNDHVDANVVNNVNFGVLDEFLNVKDAEELVEESMDEEESSGTTTTNTASTTKNKKSNKVDRTKTLTSERKRRGRMKDKLYALRSLVPNITKMDKASIVGDAVLYVQDLQMQAKKLKSEISGLESSLIGEHKGNTTIQNSKKLNITSFCPIVKKIYKMDAFQLEERDFYVRITSNKGQGVVVSLYKAVESLTSFNTRSSNLADSAGNYVFTFTLRVIDREMDISLPILKQWITSAFLNQGFDFETSSSS